MENAKKVLQSKGTLTIREYRYELFSGGWRTAYDIDFHHSESGEWWSAIGEASEKIIEQWVLKV